jgi:hypothetical protein
MKNSLDKYIIVIILILSSILLQRKYINEFPSHIHAWAQSDRYALALGFIKNNFDFFHPQTYVMNHQFPGKFNVPSENSITAVDFPIHDYLPAVVMKLSHSTSPWCFRLYILMYSLIGLFFLYKFCQLLEIDIYKSVLIIIFAITSPVYAYYQAGFLPTIPSIANVFIGLYFYLGYKKNSTGSYFYWSIAFLTLAALSRTPFVILILAIIGVELFNAFKSKNIEVNKFLAVILSFIVIGCYFLYNNYLRNKYGSMFLNHPLLSSNLKEIKEILKTVKENWLYDYFSRIHYFLLTILLIISAILIVIKKVTLSNIQKVIFFLIVIIFLGCSMYSFLMLKQFPQHDYYFLDTFYIPFILSFVLLLSVMPVFKRTYINFIINSFILIIIIFLFSSAKSAQERRRVTGNWDAIEQTIKNFDHSNEFLDSLKIPKDAKILDLCSYAPNISFIKMDRKGYALLSTSEKDIKRVLNWKFDFIVLQDEFFLSEIYSNYPDIINRIENIGDNGKISVYKLSKGEKKRSLFDFLGLQGKVPFLSKKITFDSIAGTEWQNTKATTLVNYSGTSSGIVTKEDEFGITFKTKNIEALKYRGMLLYVKAFFLKNPNPLNDCFIVASISTSNENIYYKSYNLSNLIKSGKSWEELNLLFQLPQVNKNDFEVDIYIWNRGRNLLYYDDFEIKLF